MREVTIQGKTSYRHIHSTKNIIIHDSVDESSQKEFDLKDCPPTSTVDSLDESGNEMESEPSPSNSDAKDLTHQCQCGIERDFLDFKEFVWGGARNLKEA